MCSCTLEYEIPGLLKEIKLECRSVCAQEIKTLYASTKAACNTFKIVLVFKEAFEQKPRPVPFTSLPQMSAMLL